MSVFIDPTSEQFRDFAKSSVTGKVMMLNLLKFKKDGGEQQYQKYMAATTPFMQKTNAKVIFYGKPTFSFIGPTELEWDKVLIVEYANKADFLNMITAEGYPAAMRTAALEDSRLIVCE